MRSGTRAVGIAVHLRRGEIGFAMLALGIVRAPADFDETPARVFTEVARAMGRRIVVRLPRRARGLVRSVQP